MWQAVARPDIPATARSAGVSPNTVWRKLKEWHEDGFISGYQYIPNPISLGVGMEVVRVHLDSEINCQSFLHRLNEADGVFSADVSWGPRTAVTMIADGAEGRAQRIDFMSSIRGVTEIADPRTIWLPSPTRRLRPGEVHLISALRKKPFSSWAELSRACGIPSRTIARRYHAARSSNAMLTVRFEDFAHFPTSVGLMGVSLAPRADSRSVAREILTRVPEALEYPLLWYPPNVRSSSLAFAVESSSLQLLQKTAAECGRVRGVTGVQVRLHVSQLPYGQWFDRAVERLGSSNPTTR